MKFLSYLIVLIIGFVFGSFYQSNKENKSIPSAEVAQDSNTATNVAANPGMAINQPVAVQSNSLPEKKADDPVSMKEQFDQIYQKQNFSQAAVFLDQMQKQWPQSLQYLEARSRLLSRTRDWEKAKEVLKECVSLYPSSKSCLLDLASAELQIGSKEEQEVAITACNARLQNNPECQNMLGHLRINQGRFAEAADIFRQLIKNNGSFGIRFDEGMLYGQLAIAVENGGKHSEALKYYQKACQLNWENSCERLQNL